jgi:type I restriction enzyme M protein
VARYFTKEQAAIDRLKTELETVAATLGELGEEHGNEGGILQDVTKKSEALAAYREALITLWNEEDKAGCSHYIALMESARNAASRLRELREHPVVTPLKNNKGNLTLTAIKTRIGALEDCEEKNVLNEYLETDKRQKKLAREANEQLTKAETELLAHLADDPLSENAEDLAVVVRYLELLDQQSDLKAGIKEKEKELDGLAYAKYAQLTPDEVKTLVIDDKWFTALAMAVQGEIDRISRNLTSRIRELAERYQTPLPEMTRQVEKKLTCCGKISLPGATVGIKSPRLCPG